MPLSTECRNAHGKNISVAEALKLNRDETRDLMCISCGQRVSSHRQSADGKQAAHFEHVRIKAVLTLFVLFHLVLAYGQAPAPDLILINGKTFTSNTRQRYAEALAIQGERILTAGTPEQIKRLAGKDAKIVDLGGRTVIPGINDAHKHLFIAPQNSVEVDSSD